LLKMANERGDFWDVSTSYCRGFVGYVFLE